jgi:hypothetical protein
MEETENVLPTLSFRYHFLSKSAKSTGTDFMYKKKPESGVGKVRKAYSGSDPVKKVTGPTGSRSTALFFAYLSFSCFHFFD